MMRTKTIMKMKTLMVKKNKMMIKWCTVQFLPHVVSFSASFS